MNSLDQTENFQSLATSQGNSFEEAVVTNLRIAGWTIDELRAKAYGAEIDIIATDPDGVQWWIECKGSWRGNQQGCRRGDTVKKAVGVAWFLQTQNGPKCPYMLITSHLPNLGTMPERMLDAALVAGLFERICLHTDIQSTP